MANDTTAKQLNAVAQAYRDMMNKQPDAVVVETSTPTPAAAPVSSVKSTLSKINQVAQAYRDMQVKPIITEAKFAIPEEIAKEDASDFTVAASAAKKAGKKKFTFGGKEYPVTIKTDIKTESEEEKTVKKGNVTIDPEEKDSEY